MKIGILTHPLKCNYGGLLQAFALQAFLQEDGHSVIFFNRDTPSSTTKSKRKRELQRIKVLSKALLSLFVHRYRFEYHLIKSTRKFVKQYYSSTETLYSTEDLRKVFEREKCDAVVVGSDQVWRPDYVHNIEDYFLGFTDRSEIKRISYAASFGVDSWIFTEEQTETCNKLAQNFNAISVREDTGIDLCKQYLGVNATLVLDPTLLLDASKYNELIKEFPCLKGNTIINTYILDSDPNKGRVISSVAKSVGGKVYSTMPSDDYKFEQLYPSVENWIRGFRDGDIIITDSFHGTVFSIIYNKPFWVLGNQARGMTRLTSILRMFGLEERMITINDYEKIDFKSKIDWKEVNAKLSSWKELSKEFLRNNLV